VLKNQYMHPTSYRATRRQLLCGSAGMLLAAAMPLGALAAARPTSAATGNEPVPFDRSTVVNLARDLAKKEFVPPPSELPEAIADLTYDQYRDIRFRGEAAIWADTDLPFRLQLFHRGFYFQNRIDVAIVDGDDAYSLVYSPDMFTFGEHVPRPLPETDIGFSGIRLLSKINGPDKFDEIAVFHGASYLRSLGRNQSYGLSARGLALNTAAAEGEEFPLFRSFWAETPVEDSQTIVVHALLDSESVAGAYRFTIRPGASTVMDVEAVLFPRIDLDSVGLAPGTSMFMFGPNGRHDVDDYRPEVHDSDGLLIANGRGERLWRPLANPDKLQISAFVDAGPRGFGLIQRNRDFDSYQDVEAAYERRTSLWVEPVGDWGRGSVTLIEIPSESEIHDNIVAYWSPRDAIPANSEFSFAYRLFWGTEPSMTAGGLSVASTRSGRATIDGPSPVRLFVVDYVMNGSAPDASVPEPKATVQASAGKIDHIVVLNNPATGGWRLTFNLDPEDAELIELRAVIEFTDGRACETWVYRWTI
jgi:periplasmic glucans biosynthesis protein